MSIAPQSVSQWFLQLKIGDAEAAQNLWDRYSTRLIEQAYKRLGSAPKRVADEEDIAICVFQSLCRGAKAGRFDDFKNRDDLWWLLLALTKQKAVDHVRREMAQKRGGGHVMSETAMNGEPDESKGFTLDYLIGDEPTPDFLIALEEENRRLLNMLRDDRLREIAVRRLEGYSVLEIAEELGLSTRTIERKLQLIRTTWSEELSGVC